MKARVKGTFAFDTKNCGAGHDIIVEADSIEIVPDPPKKRDVRDWDVAGGEGDVLIATPTGDWGVGNVLALTKEGDEISLNWAKRETMTNSVLFNLTDLVSAMQKAMKAGRTKKAISVKSDNYLQSSISEGDHNNIEIHWSCIYKDKVVAKSTARQFAMELLGLCVEGQE